MSFVASDMQTQKEVKYTSSSEFLQWPLIIQPIIIITPQDTLKK